MRTIFASCVAALVALLITTPQASFASDKFITIGTGGVTGVYYPAGGAICRLVNRGRRDHGIRCSVESTGGSVYNLNALRANELDVAVAQSDWQYHSVKGTGPFADKGGDDKLRALFSLHSEPFTVIARNDAGVKSFDDLKGKRVNIGNPGSGMRATMEVIMERKGWTKKDFKLASELKASEQAQALCDNKIDVMIYAAGHPNGAVQEVTTTCETTLIPVEGGNIDTLVEEFPFYAYTVIPGGMYTGNEEDIRTFGVKATFVSSADVDEEVVYQVVKSVFDNFDNFKTLHPVFSTLEPKALVTEGNTAPTHAGAKRYFEENGLIENGASADTTNSDSKTTSTDTDEMSTKDTALDEASGVKEDNNTDDTKNIVEKATDATVEAGKDIVEGTKNATEAAVEGTKEAGTETKGFFAKLFGWLFN